MGRRAFDLLLLQAALLANHRISIEKNLQIRIRKNFCADVAALHDHATTYTHLALTGYHPLAHFGVNRHAGRRFRYVSLPHTRGDIALIQQHAIPAQARLQANGRLVSKIDERGLIIERDIPFDRF